MNEEKLKILEIQRSLLNMTRDVIESSNLPWSLARPIFDALYKEENRLIDAAFHSEVSLV